MISPTDLVDQQCSISHILNTHRSIYIEVRALLRHHLNCDDAWLIIHQDSYFIHPITFENINDDIDKLYHGYPLAYIVGYKEFYSRKFMVSPSVLIPRPETELLIDLCLSLAGNKHLNVLDLGTGSGCIAISLKLENPNLSIMASDKCPQTLAIAKKNARILNADIEFLQSDWLDNIPQKSFDIIVSNPPYIAKLDSHLTHLQYEPRIALTDDFDGLSHYRTIIKNANKFLTKGGYLIFEHGYKQAEKITELLKENGYNDVLSLNDLSGISRISYAYKSK